MDDDEQADWLALWKEVDVLFNRTTRQQQRLKAFALLGDQLGQPSTASQ